MPAGMNDRISPLASRRRLNVCVVSCVPLPNVRDSCTWAPVWLDAHRRLRHARHGGLMRFYVKVTGVVFGFLAAAQLVRTLWAVPIQVADIAIPVWCSGVACIFLAALAT